MLKQAREFSTAILLITPLILLLFACGESPVTQQTNVAPQTEVRASSPRAESEGFAVDFSFSGSDADGEVDYFEWRVLTRGSDEQQWTQTYNLEVTLRFPENIGGLGFEGGGSQRTFEVRAVDNEGLVDPTAALIDFTPLTLAPEISLSFSRPPGGNSCISSSRYLTFRWTASDVDSKSGAPEFIRYALVNVHDVWVPGSGPLERGACLTRFEYEALSPVLQFGDWAWSNWIAYDPNADASDPSRMVAYPPRDFGESYFFAVQARDIDGATSRTFDWNQQVVHFRVQPGKVPLLLVDEVVFGQEVFAGAFGIRAYDISPGQELSFSWEADASAYLGEIDGFRYGWDLLDPNDVDDPGWLVDWGDWNQAPTVSFAEGTHNFVVQTRDNSGEITRATYELTVVSP